MDKQTRNILKVVLTFFIVGILYRVLSLFTYSQPQSLETNLFFIGSITLIGGLIYTLLSLTKLKEYTKLAIAGFLEPIGYNLTVIIFNGWDFSILRPIMILDSIFIMIGVLSVYWLLSKWKVLK